MVQREVTCTKYSRTGLKRYQELERDVTDASVPHRLAITVPRTVESLRIPQQPTLSTALQNPSRTKAMQ